MKELKYFYLNINSLPQRLVYMAETSEKADATESAGTDNALIEKVGKLEAKLQKATNEAEKSSIYKEIAGAILSKFKYLLYPGNYKMLNMEEGSKLKPLTFKVTGDKIEVTYDDKKFEIERSEIMKPKTPDASAQAEQAVKEAIAKGATPGTSVKLGSDNMTSTSQVVDESIAYRDRAVDINEKTGDAVVFSLKQGEAQKLRNTFLETEADGKMKVNFHKNKYADRFIGLKDLFKDKGAADSLYQLIKVEIKGKKIYAQRQNDGYYKNVATGRRVAIHENDKISIPKDEKELASFKGKAKKEAKREPKGEKAVMEDKDIIAQLPAYLIDAALVIRESDFDINKPGAIDYLKKCLSVHKAAKRKDTYADWLITAREVQNNKTLATKKGEENKGTPNQDMVGPPQPQPRKEGEVEVEEDNETRKTKVSAAIAKLGQLKPSEQKILLDTVLKYEGFDPEKSNTDKSILQLCVSNYVGDPELKKDPANSLPAAFTGARKEILEGLKIKRSNNLAEAIKELSLTDEEKVSLKTHILSKEGKGEYFDSTMPANKKLLEKYAEVYSWDKSKKWTEIAKKAEKLMAEADKEKKRTDTIWTYAKELFKKNDINTDQLQTFVEAILLKGKEFNISKRPDDKRFMAQCVAEYKKLDKNTPDPWTKSRGKADLWREGVFATRAEAKRVAWQRKMWENLAKLSQELGLPGDIKDQIGKYIIENYPNLDLVKYAKTIQASLKKYGEVMEQKKDKSQALIAAAKVLEKQLRS